MKIGFYPGSFDPFTNGHLHIVKTSSALFDKVIVGIGANPYKDRRYNRELMKTAIEETLKKEELNNVDVLLYDNLSADVALSCNANFIIRGLRNDMDYRYEENLSLINEEISGLDTIYIRSGILGFISSSMIVELIANNRDVSKYLPLQIWNAIK